MSSVEDSQVIDRSVNRAYLARHISVGLLTFLIARGIFLAPLQNMKVLTQLDLLTNKSMTKGDKERAAKKWAAQVFDMKAMFVEFTKQTLGLFAKVFTNSLGRKYVGATIPVLSSAVAACVTYPLAVSRMNRLFNRWYLDDETTSKKESQNALVQLSSWKSFGLYTTRFVLEDMIGNALSTFLVSKYNERSEDSHVAVERLIQTFSLASVRILLNPLEYLLHSTLLSQFYYSELKSFVNIPMANEEDAAFAEHHGRQVRDVALDTQHLEEEQERRFGFYYFRGSLFVVKETISYIFLKYGVSTVLRHYLE